MRSDSLKFAQKTPCRDVKPKFLRRVFVYPEGATAEQIHRAKKLCKACPLLETCAKDAISAGDSFAGDSHGPANGVIQAGVLCRGDKATLNKLESIAGVKAVQDEKNRKRIVFGQPCRSCGVPMVKWSRNQPAMPEGYVAHRGRGFCTGCRAAYKKDLEEWRAAHPEDALKKAVVRKPTDRKRSSLGTYPGRITTALKAGDRQQAEALMYQWVLEKDQNAVNVAISKGYRKVRLPGREAKFNAAIREWQDCPSATARVIADRVGVAEDTALKAAVSLRLAGHPAFIDHYTRMREGRERQLRVKWGWKMYRRWQTRQRHNTVKNLLRDRPDLTQREIAAFAGVGLDTVSRINTGTLDRHREKDRRRKSAGRA